MKASSSQEPAGVVKLIKGTRGGKHKVVRPLTIAVLLMHVVNNRNQKTHHSIATKKGFYNILGESCEQPNPGSPKPRQV